MNQKPTWLDALILSLFTLLITFHPFYTRQEINLFELGLYLPGINAIFHGQVPFRDFFHLRGPLELYVPAFLMSVFGKNLAVLNTYFYIGTILTLIICILIAVQLYRTRFILYLMVPVLVARTFPRVVFAIWGGMRFALGMLALFFIVRFLQREKLIWIFLAGITTALGIFTSVEIGVCSLIAFAVVVFCSFVFKVQERRLILKSILTYLAGLLIVAGPFCLYLASQQALVPYWDSMYAVVVNMQKVIDPHFVSEYPRNLKEALAAMLNPSSKNFRHMTPSYLYLFLLIYLGWRIKNKKFDRTDLAVVGLGTYGFIIYNTAFRGIWAAQFEMALQPEKILWFYVLEVAFLFLMAKKNIIKESDYKTISKNLSFPNALVGNPKEAMAGPPTTTNGSPRYEGKTFGGDIFGTESIQRWNVYAINLFFIALIGSSLGYAVMRYHHRFFAFRYLEHLIQGKNTEHLKPLAGRTTRPLDIERAKGIVVPAQQAEEIEAVVNFIQQHTTLNEKIVFYPDQGIYHFFSNRPFLGRFPIPVFSWFNDRWHEEFMTQLKEEKPKFLTIPQELAPDWKAVHLALSENRKKYTDVMNILALDYILEKTTPSSYIYKHK